VAGSHTRCRPSPGRPLRPHLITPTPVPTPDPTPQPPPSTAPTVHLTAPGVDLNIDGNTPATIVTDGNTFSLLGHGVAAVAAGQGTESMSFAHMNSVILAGGAGSTTITADAGTNTWTAGTGSLSITGGSGADAFVFHQGSGALTISGFSAAQGDTLTIDASLKASMTEQSDGSGGTQVSFGAGSAGIDLKGINPTTALPIHWA
jgi:Ca2+-binding RTX toxin-like protein